MSKTKARQKPGFELQINLHLFKAVVNPAFGQVIWGHLNLHFVASQNTDAVFAHLTCRMCDDLMAVFQLDPNGRSSFTTPGNSSVSSLAMVSPMCNARNLLRAVRLNGGF